MSVLGISTAGSSAQSQQAVQQSGHHKHGRHPSLTDLATQSSNFSSMPSLSGKVGGKLNVTA
jgi:hypothetical protein